MKNAPKIKTLEVNGILNNSVVLLSESLTNVQSYLPDRFIILTDSNLHELYKELFPKGPQIIIDPGEGSKSIETAIKVYKEMMRQDVDRSFFLLAIGGGVVCDLGGFVASTYMRGIPFGFISTSLLSQVDASIGGKNGINFSGVKNMIGVYNQPEFVICDHSLLTTLSTKERLSGFAEIIKSALIHDASLFDTLERSYEAILNLEQPLISDVIYCSVKIKKSIVEADEREQGLRRLLNFGHTFGHAIEIINKTTHGEAISLGMLIATWISEKEGSLSSFEGNRIRNFINSCGVKPAIKIESGKLIKEIKKDKKKEENKIHFVLLRSVGDAYIKEMEISVLEDYLQVYVSTFI